MGIYSVKIILVCCGHPEFFETEKLSYYYSVVKKQVKVKS